MRLADLRAFAPSALMATSYPESKRACGAQRNAFGVPIESEAGAEFEAGAESEAGGESEAGASLARSLIVNPVRIPT